MLQCVAACCSVLHLCDFFLFYSHSSVRGVTLSLFCSVVHCVVVHCIVCCSELQCELQCVAVCCSVCCTKNCHVSQPKFYEERHVEPVRRVCCIALQWFALCVAVE